MNDLTTDSAAMPVRGRTRRAVLSTLVALIGIMAGTAACDSSPTGAAPGTSGSYDLASVKALANIGGGGNGIPVNFTDGAGSTLTFHEGELILGDDGTYDIYVDVTFKTMRYDAGDSGSYTRNGNSISFISDYGPSDNFTATVSGSRIVAKYKVAGLQFELELKK